MVELKVGSLVLGAIREVSITELVVNLPYNSTATIINDQTVDGIELAKKSLSDRYSVGQLVACAVISNEHGRIEASLRPSIINAGITADTISQGMRLPAVVVALEEHGFLLNIGVRDTKCFLKKRHVDDVDKLSVGQVISVVVGSVNSASGLVTVFQVGENEHGINSKKLVPLECIKPGTIFEYIVKGDRAPADFTKRMSGKSSSGDLLPQTPLARESNKAALTAITEVVFNGRFPGIIDQQHKKVSGTEIEQLVNVCDLSVDSKGRARVLAVLPNSKEIHLSILPHLMRFQSANLPQNCVVPGTKVDARVVAFIGSKTARLVISSPDAPDEKALGYVHVSRASAEKKELIKDALTIPSKVEGKVLHANFLEGSIGVSTRPQDVEGVHFALQDVKIGQIVEGTVVKVHEAFLVVALSDTVAGLVNLEHVNDVPLKKMPTKFSQGMKAKFRVIDVDIERRRLILTAKKSIASADDSELITSWDDVEENKCCVGWVVGEKPFGTLVAFPGRIVGVIPSAQLKIRKEKADNLRKQGRGAVVKVKIVKFDKEKKQITLSLDLDDSSPILSLVSSALADPDVPSTKKLSDDEKVRNVQEAEFAAGEHISGKLFFVKADEQAIYLSTVDPASLPNEGAVKRDEASDKKSKKKNVVANKKATVVIPIGHLADDAQQAVRAHVMLMRSSSTEKTQKLVDALCKVKRQNNNISAVTLACSKVINEQTMVLASLKSSLISCPSPFSFSKTWGDLAFGDLKLAYVQKVEDFGVFVSFGRLAVSALCQKRSVADEFITTAEGHAFIGQVLLVKVVAMSKNSKDLSKDEKIAQIAVPGEVSSDMRPGTITKYTPAATLKAFKVYMAESGLETEKVLMEAGEKKANETSIEHWGDVCREESSKTISANKGKFDGAIGDNIREAKIVAKIYGGIGKIGIMTVIESSNAYAFIPAIELVDHFGATGSNLMSRPEYEINKRIKVKLMSDIKLHNFSYTPQGSSAQLKPLIVSARPSVVTNTMTESTIRDKKVAQDFNLGDRVLAGVVVTSGPSGVFVQITPLLVGRIKLSELTNVRILPADVPVRFPVGTVIADLRVISADKSAQVDLSAKAADDEKLLRLEHLSEGAIVKARVKKTIAERGLLITIVDSAKIDVLVPFDKLGDAATVTADSFLTGSLVKAIITKKTENRVWASLKPSDLAKADADSSDEEDEENEDDVEIDSASESEDAEESGSEDVDVDSESGEDLSDMDISADDSDSDSDSDSEEIPPAKVAKKTSAVQKSISSAPSSKLAALVKSTKNSNVLKKNMVAESNSDSDSDDNNNSENDSDSDLKSKKSKLSMDPLALLALEEAQANAAGSSSTKLNKRTKEAMRRAEELKLRDAESRRAAALGDEEPETVDEFERLLVSESSRSVTWMKYIAYHLKLSNLGAAREVADRAVKYGTIMTEREKTNIWIAYLNMECVFGSPQRFKEILAKACQFCDRKEIMVQVIKVLEVNGQQQQAIEAAANATQKFAQDSDVWIRRLELLYTLKKLSDARDVFPKALQSISKKEHPHFTAVIARMEFKMGSTERGQTIFDGLLSTYPKRTDLWSQFFDAMINSHISSKTSATSAVRAKGVEAVRRVMEKATDLEGLKPKKMKFFYKRWLAVESEFGTETHQNLVKSKAREYIQKLEQKIRGGSKSAANESESESEAEVNSDSDMD